MDIIATYDFGSGSIAIGHEITIAAPTINAHIVNGGSLAYAPRSLPDGEKFCVLDSDGDGVGDNSDLCAQTPAEQPVDAVGHSSTQYGFSATATDSNGFIEVSWSNSLDLG